jgi:hypothetical protein
VSKEKNLEVPESEAWFAEYAVAGHEPTDWAYINNSYGTKDYAEACANNHPEAYCRVRKWEEN